MKRGTTGRYETRVLGGEAVRAYIPSPLPPEPPVDLAGPLGRLHDRALIACGRLDAITVLLPDPDLFLYAYVRREALVSSQIEGTQSSLSDLLLFELDEAPGVPFDDVVEVSNYVAALEHGLTRLGEGFPLSNRLVREMHEKLLSHGRGAERQPGRFRSSQNWIGGTRPGNAVFVPPPPDQVEPCMAALERFLHDEQLPLSPLVRAGLAHAQFETVHPFLDGNGRIGRLLIAVVLHREGVLRQPLLYLSLYLKRHRAEYYRQLDAVRRDGDWENWLEFFLEGVEQTAAGAVDTAHRILELFSRDGERLPDLGRRAGAAMRVFEALRRRPLATLPDLAQRTGLSYPAASRGVESLRELRIVREISGRRRERVFVYEEYLAVLSEGAEPI